MWELCASSVLIVSKAVGDPKKKANSQKTGVKKNPRKEILLFIEAGMWDPSASSVHNFKGGTGSKEKGK